jgi:hypothetical protein
MLVRQHVISLLPFCIWQLELIRANTRCRLMPDKWRGDRPCQRHGAAMFGPCFWRKRTPDTNS